MTNAKLLRLYATKVKGHHGNIMPFFIP